MRSLSVVPILCAAVLAMPSTALGQDASGAETAIAELAEAWDAGWNAGDGTAIAALYTEDAMLLPPGSEPISGREAIAAFWQGEVESGSQSQLTPGAVEDFGDTAIEVNGSWVATAPDGSHLDHGKYTVVYKKVDGAWLMHRDMWNSSMTQ